jgi:hypothetical protein
MAVEQRTTFQPPDPLPPCTSWRRWEPASQRRDWCATTTVAGPAIHGESETGRPKAARKVRGTASMVSAVASTALVFGVFDAHVLSRPAVRFHPAAIFLHLKGCSYDFHEAPR